VVLAGSVTVQKLVFESRYDVSGHAAEHLSSATVPFVGFAAVVILLWATPTARSQADVLIACLAWLAATVLVLVGNVRVVDDLVDAGLGHAPTEGLPDVGDHGLANLAAWLAVVAAVAMAIVFWRRGHVSLRVALGAGVLSVVPAMDRPRGRGDSSRRGTVHRPGEIVEAIHHDCRRSSDAQYLATHTGAFSTRLPGVLCRRG
jgi:hypothetical protein